MGILAFLAFVSCEKQKAARQKLEAPSLPSEMAIASPTTVMEKVDTTYYTQHPYKRREYPYMKRKSEFKAGEDVYTAITEVYSLNDSSFTEIQRDSVQGKLKSVQITKAHNHVYKIQLSKNGKPLFSKQFTKHDFLKLENDGFIIESVPIAAEFRGVTEDGRVLFDIWFGLPESDYGGISFFATDLKGNLLQLESYSSTGGNGCDGIVHTSPNRRYFLNCHTLYGPDGYKFKFSKPDMVTAEFISDTSFFALYDYVEHSYDKVKKEWETKYDRESNNLIFYHINGRKLASYRYDGFYNELDYTAPVFGLKDYDLLFMLNEEKQQLHSYSTANPTSSKIWSLKEVTQLKKRPKNDIWKEQPLESFLGNKYHFYFSSDTLKAFYVKEN